MGKSVTTPMVLLDNTILSNFALIGRTDLIYSLWADVARTTKPVLEEYQAGTITLNLPKGAWKGLVVDELSAEEMARAAMLPHQLGAGERSCLAVAILRKTVFASDDRLARKHASRAGLIVIGSIGILIRCIRKDLIDKPGAQELLDKMIMAHYYSPITSFDEILDE
jgi:predicted nucleic acid-binding protein